MPRYSQKNPAPKRCATCKFASRSTGDAECAAPLPAWARDALDSEDFTPYIDANDHTDPKCPLWAPRAPTAH